ncbi:hypothetical protein LBMAG57_32040 [Verrucomicrobiota bacterium]|jgi:hypothetical protein|nr:hypothetical protein LBMAG57_32040 [Verrucomicrobiota bacterium]
MSLKIFHICFIILSTLLCAGVAWWCVANDIAKTCTWIFATAAALLPIYGVWFLWKTRKLIL